MARYAADDRSRTIRHDTARSDEALDGMRRDLDDASSTVSLRLADLLDRTRSFVGGSSTRAVVIAGVVAVIVAMAIAVVVVRSGHSSEATPIVPANAPAVGSAPSTATTTAPGIVVQASGAVRSPGVYRMPIGSRVVDLLDRAGGPAPGLDLDRVNLAAVLTDGQRVWLPHTGETPPPLAEGAIAGGGTGGSRPTLVDVNHASADQLDALPGIGPTLAKAIVVDRERHGAFRSVDDLLRVKGLSRSKVDAIREVVIIG